MASEAITKNDLKAILEDVLIAKLPVDDYVVEHGTDGIWTYRKWNSGFAECWGTESAKSYAITGSWTNGFYAQSTLVYPSGLFVSIPVTTLQKTDAGAGLEWMSIHTHSASQVSFYVCDTQSHTVSFSISAYAIGRWK